MKMKLTLDGIKDKKSWEAAGVVLPSYDIEKVKEEQKIQKKNTENVVNIMSEGFKNIDGN